MYHLCPLSHYRRLTNSILRLANLRNMHPVALNLIVRVAESRVHDLMTFFMKSVGDVLQSNLEFAILNSTLDRCVWRNRVVVSDDLSFSIYVEKVFEGENVVAIYVLCDVMRRGLNEITAEYATLKFLPIVAFSLFRKMRCPLSAPVFFIYLFSGSQSCLYTITTRTTAWGCRI